jgi:predicted extracellular nuclease
LRRQTRFQFPLLASCLGLLLFVGGFASAEQACRHVYQAKIIQRKLEQIKEIKLMAYNVENLFWSTGKATVAAPLGQKFEAPAPKSEAQIQVLRDIIDKENADILILTEVESLTALEHLAESSLERKYKSFLIEGNDPRGIDIGFLVKSDLPVVVEQRSYKDVEWFDPAEKRTDKLFCRDLPVLIFRNQVTGAPLLIVIGNHAKSKINRPGDPDSEVWRTAQYQEAAKIVAQYEKEFPNVPLVFGGDFNTQVNTSPEVQPLKPYLTSAFDLAKDATPQTDRITHTYHPRDLPTEKSQLDDLKVSPNLKDRVLEAKVVRYRDQAGKILPFANTFDERKIQPSDHLPIMIRINTEGFW